MTELGLNFGTNSNSLVYIQKFVGEITTKSGIFTVAN